MVQNIVNFDHILVIHVDHHIDAFVDYLAIDFLVLMNQTVS